MKTYSFCNLVCTLCVILQFTGYQKIVRGCYQIDPSQSSGCFTDQEQKVTTRICVCKTDACNTDNICNGAEKVNITLVKLAIVICSFMMMSKFWIC